MTEGFNIQRDEKTDSRHNLTWHMMEINRQKREKQMQQKAFTIWMSGLSGAGKSTIANVLEKRLPVNIHHMPCEIVSAVCFFISLCIETLCHLPSPFYRNGIRKMKKCRKKLFSSLQQLLWISEERMKFSVRK